MIHIVCSFLGRNTIINQFFILFYFVGGGEFLILPFNILILTTTTNHHPTMCHFRNICKHPGDQIKGI